MADIWCPHIDVGDDARAKGFNGQIYTIALCEPSDGNWDNIVLRQPRNAFCRAEGPYVDFGAHFVLDDNTRLSPIVAVLAQVEHRNKHEAAASRRAAKNKRIGVMDALSLESGQRINAAKDGEVVVVDGVDKAHLIEMELGGITEPQMAYLAYLRQSLDRSASMGDSQRGEVTGLGTARENDIAFQATSARIGFLKRRFTKQTAEVFNAFGHCMFYEDRCVFPIALDEAPEMGPILMAMRQLGLAGESAIGDVLTPVEPWFVGGNSNPIYGFSYTDLEMDVEPESMGRVPENQQAMQFQVLQWLMQQAPLLPQVPYVKLAELLDCASDITNFPRLRELIDYKLLGQMPLQPDPRMAGDVGAKTTRPQFAGVGGGRGGGGAAGTGRALPAYAAVGAGSGRAPGGPAKPAKPSGPAAPRTASQGRTATALAPKAKPAPEKKR